MTYLDSQEGTKAGSSPSNSPELERLASVTIDCGLHVHRTFGPGLLETVYEAVMFEELSSKGLAVERQRPVDIFYRDKVLREGFRIDLLVNDTLVLELKSLERLAPVHGKQLLTYLRLADKPLGFLMNFGAETFKDGLRRVSNNYYGTWRTN